jgi:hypothetical protein
MSDTKPEEIEDDDMDFEVEFTTREEYFSSCATLLDIAETMNPMTYDETKIKKNITRRCYKILDVMSAEMYDELFDDREDLEDN